MHDISKSSDTFFLGHPKGLVTLFLTEMWERMSFYGMRGLLVLFMTREVTEGGMNLDAPEAMAIYGIYGASVYFLCVPGGWIADKLFGAQRTVLYGAVIITLGHYVLAIPYDKTFFLGLVLVYFIRFYSLAFNGIKSGYEKINISVDESSYLLGYSKKKTFMNIHIPFLRKSLLFVGILISLEIIRELPITLILRPFNFETFATTAYISASEDLLEAAAVPSLFLILIASFFIMLTSKYILRDNEQ